MDFDRDGANAEFIAAAPETAAERDRLQAENAALVTALRTAIYWAHTHGGHSSPSYETCDRSLCRNARAALAAHAARTQEGPR